jgi:hypothetical protein
MTVAPCPAKRGALYIWLARGVLGVALLVVAMLTREPLVGIPALLGALIVFRGCPMCWVFGLIERGSRDVAPSARKDAP